MNFEIRVQNLGLRYATTICSFDFSEEMTAGQPRVVAAVRVSLSWGLFIWRS